MTTKTGTSHIGARGLLAATPSRQAFLLLRTVFTVAPIVFGLDKFANVLTDWPAYLAPLINDIVPGTAQQAMYAVGVVEIFAGVAVALMPRYGALLVAALAGRNHRQPAADPRLLRRRAARLRPARRRVGTVQAGSRTRRARARTGACDDGRHGRPGTGQHSSTPAADRRTAERTGPGGRPASRRRPTRRVGPRPHRRASGRNAGTGGRLPGRDAHPAPRST